MPPKLLPPDSTCADSVVTHRCVSPATTPTATQDVSLPPPLRLAAAMASAGPSITLAAACEVAAFGLGGVLTSMPAVRNFSLAAAAAVLLDFVLQVGGGWVGGGRVEAVGMWEVTATHQLVACA